MAQKIGKKKFKVYITDYIRRHIVFDKSILGDGIEIKLLQEKDEKRLFPAIADADAIIVDKTPITEYTLSRVPNCKILCRYGIGFDNVDIQAAARHGIFVVNCPDFCHEEVADHAIGLMLSMSRNIVGYNNGLLKGNRKNWRPFGLASTTRLRGKTIGILGLGRIGKEVAKRCAPFGLKVLFYDPNVDEQTGKIYGAQKTSIVKELTSQADIITFHLPLNPETKVMANDEFFRHVKKGAYLINTARGGVLETKALLKAMKNGTIEKAALDVIEREPIDFDEPLFRKWIKDEKLQNHLIITPHVGFYSPESTKEIEEKMMRNIKLVFAGKEPNNCVNKDYFK